MIPHAYYSLATGRMQGVWIPTDPSEQPADLPGQGHLPLDANFTKQFAQRGPGALDDVQTFLIAATGLSPFDAQGNPLDRYVFFQNGVVVDVVGNADPALGHLNEKTALWPQAQMAVHATAVPGWTVAPNALSGFTFSAPPPSAQDLANQQAKAARSVQANPVGD